MSRYWELTNPCQNLESATISESPIGYHLAIHYKAFNNKNDLYAHRTLTAAKRYFGRTYQPKCDGNETPVWRKCEVDARIS